MSLAPRRRVSRRTLRASIVLLLLALAGPVRADGLVADLTSHMIGITTGFTGASVVLFGATDGPGDVVVVVRGPERDITVRRKSRIAGIWINTRQIAFESVPSFYALAASRPVEEIVLPTTATLYKLGLANLKLQPIGPTRPVIADEFRTALIRSLQRENLFPAAIGKVNFLGERLFRTTISFPANVPTGTYLVEVFLIRDQDVISGQTTPLVVSKVGVDAEVFDFAEQRSALYGLAAVLIAALAGWLASFMFRRA